jgi:hypothetical protein
MAWILPVSVRSQDLRDRGLAALGKHSANQLTVDRQSRAAEKHLQPIADPVLKILQDGKPTDLDSSQIARPPDGELSG